MGGARYSTLLVCTATCLAFVICPRDSVTYLLATHQYPGHSSPHTSVATYTYTRGKIPEGSNLRWWIFYTFFEKRLRDFVRRSLPMAASSSTHSPLSNSLSPKDSTKLCSQPEI